MIPRYLTGWEGEEWRIKPLMTPEEFKRSPATPAMYETYKEYVKHSNYLNWFLELPENRDLLNLERVR